MFCLMFLGSVSYTHLDVYKRQVYNCIYIKGYEKNSFTKRIELSCKNSGYWICLLYTSQGLYFFIEFLDHVIRVLFIEWHHNLIIREQKHTTAYYLYNLLTMSFNLRLYLYKFCIKKMLQNTLALNLLLLQSFRTPYS